MPHFKPACVASIFWPRIRLTICANRPFTFWAHYMESNRFHCEVLGPTRNNCNRPLSKAPYMALWPLDSLGVWTDSTRLDLYSVNSPEPFLRGLLCHFGLNDQRLQWLLWTYPKSFTTNDHKTQSILTSTLLITTRLRCGELSPVWFVRFKFWISWFLIIEIIIIPMWILKLDHYF